jgi:diadenosine tetraphosphate (Ap4A) HIT family hydrolase
MLKNTLNKFMYPNSLIKEYQDWYVLVRPMQVTLGSIIILNKNEDITAFANLDKNSFDELQLVIKDCETGLKSFINYD